MKIYKRIMLALDHTYFDRKILQFSGHFTGMFIPENLYFLHIDQNLEQNDWMAFEGNSDYPVAVPKDEVLKEELLKTVKKHYTNPYLMPLQVEVVEGKPLHTLLHWSRIKNIELMVVGRKKLSEGSGITATKLARESTCSVLFVTEDAPETIENILVPFDFSANSAHALKKALMLAKHNAEVKSVKALHVYDSPMFDQFMASKDASKLEKNIVQLKKEAFNDFIEKEGLATAGIEAVFIRNEHGHVANQLNEYIQKSNTSLVMIGANSHSFIGSWLMGSVTEKLLSLQRDIPILVQRNADF